jgi:predicted RNase H-like nuclease (RuvC/YqgF family)
MIQDMDRRIKKVQAAKKTNLKIKKDVKEKDNSAFKMRKEINELKSQNSGLA